MHRRGVISVNLTALVLVSLLVVLWNSGRNDLRIVVFFSAFVLLAGLATWIQLKGHKPPVSLVISSFVMWLFVLGWIVGTPASMHAFFVTAIVGAVLAITAGMGQIGVENGRWIGIITQAVLLLLVAFIAHQRFIEADFWTVLEVSSIGLAVVLMASFAIERTRAASRAVLETAGLRLTGSRLIIEIRRDLVVSGISESGSSWFGSRGAGVREGPGGVRALVEVGVRVAGHGDVGSGLGVATR